MPFEQTILPQYRDADPDGLIGLKGCMQYFQVIHTYSMHSIPKGNDELPDQYGAAWVYTRYHVSLKHKLDYTDSAELSVWMEPYRQPVLANLNFILRQHGQIAATGKLETACSAWCGRTPSASAPSTFRKTLRKTSPTTSRISSG